jgi:uncharacterized protein with PIN domain
MKYSVLLFVAVLVSCTGSLSDSQKKRIKESMEQGQIKKVSEAQVTEAAFAFGRKVAGIVNKSDKNLANTTLLDSLSQAYQVEIVSLQPDNQTMRSVERKLLEAYMSGGASDDNIQKMGIDSLLYTMPIVNEKPDGSTEFLKALGIRMTRKQVVLSIKK